MAMMKMVCFYIIVLKLWRYKVYSFHLANFLMIAHIHLVLLRFILVNMSQTILKQSILQFYFSKSLQIVVIIVKIEKIYQY